MLHHAIASKPSQRILFTDKHKSLLPAPTVDMHEHSNLTLLVSQVKPKRILFTDKHKLLLQAPTVDMHERSIVPLLVSQVKGFCLQTQIFTASTHSGHAWTLYRATASKSKEFAYKHKSLLTAPTVDMHERSIVPLLVSQVKGVCLQTQIFTASTHSRHAWTLQCATASKSSQTQRILLTDEHKSLLPAPTADMNTPSCHC